MNERTLLILDNVDAEDEKLSDFLTGICHVIITTRWHSQLIYPEETLSLDVKTDLKHSCEIFSAYYGKDTHDDPFVEKIISFFSGHILALELIAKQMKVSCLSPDEMWNVLQERNEIELEEGFLLPNKSRQTLNMVAHVGELSHISESWNNNSLGHYPRSFCSILYNNL